MRAAIKDAVMPGDLLRVDTAGVPGLFYLATVVAGKERVIALDLAGVEVLGSAVVSFLRANTPTPGVDSGLTVSGI